MALELKEQEELLAKIGITKNDYEKNYELFSNLNWIKDYWIPADNDFIMVIDGREGRGKSTLALVIANYLMNGNFNISWICFSPPEFYKCLDLTKETGAGQVIIIDEGENLLFTREAMGRRNKEMIKTIMQDTRRRGTIIIINIPDIMEIDKYLKHGRLGAYIHIIRRGFFAAYDHAKALRIIEEREKKRAKKLWRMPEPSFYGSWPRIDIPLWYEYYEKKKNKGDEIVIQRMRDAERNEEEMLSIREASIMLRMREEDIMTMIQDGKLAHQIIRTGEYNVKNSDILRLKAEREEYAVRLQRARRKSKIY